MDYPTRRKSYVLITHCHNTQKNGEFIICVDFIKWNLITTKYPYGYMMTKNKWIALQLCLILHWWKVIHMGLFWLLDIYIYITPRNKYKKNPCNKLGTFTWVVMPFGLKNGPPIYQWVMSQAFKEYVKNSWRYSYMTI